MKEDIKKTRRELAYRLVINHLRNSSNKIDRSEVLDARAIRPFRRRTNDIHEQRNVIAVVGAGASKSSGLKLTNEAVTEIERKFENLVAPSVLQEERKFLNEVSKMPLAGFETTLLALGRYRLTSEKLLDELKNMYNYRFPSLLTYEILAHLLKHKFIDSIINFNFDELLDQSLEDELGYGEYFYILSDGDCNEWFKSPHKESLPLYVKPHGTTSNTSSLRFTHEQYYGLPKEILKVLREQLTTKPVTLMVLGFSMQSFEFNTILENASNDIEIFFIDPNRPYPDISKDLNLRYIQFDPNSSSTYGFIGTDLQLKEIWNDVEQFFHKDHKPRGIHRHLLISTLFKEQSQDLAPNSQDLENYLKDRTVIELALSIAKGKGLVELNSLSSERCGKYHVLASKAGFNQNLTQIINNSGLNSISYSHEVFRYGSTNNKFGIVPTIDELRGRLATEIMPDLSAARRDILNNESNSELFDNTVTALYDGVEVEIRNKIDPFFDLIFRRPQHLSTHTCLQFETRRLLRDNNYNTLFIVAETGEWLCQRPFIKILTEKKPYLVLIIADDSRRKALEKIYKGLDLVIRRLNMWLHNRHMTISLKLDHSEGREGLAEPTLVKAIYFTRRNRDPKISPVLLRNRQDLDKVLDSFLAYWKKTKQQSEWLSNKNLREAISDIAQQMSQNEKTQRT